MERNISSICPPVLSLTWGKGTLSPRDPLVNVVRVTFCALLCLKGDRAGDGGEIDMRRDSCGTDQYYVC
eukprot:6463351-Karenia_brevis.AAC.1